MKKYLLVISIVLIGLVLGFASDNHRAKIMDIQDIKGLDANIKKQDIRPTGTVAPDIDFGKIPLYFITNKGQVNQTARFYAKASRYTLWLTKSGLVFDSSRRIDDGKVEEQQNRTAAEAKGAGKNPIMNPMDHDGTFARDVSRLMFLGANKNPEMVPIDTAKLKVNYFKGSDKSKWFGAVPTSMAVLYKNLYKNIDLKVYGLEKQIEYDWIVKAKGDPQAIRFEYKNAKGTRIDKDGNLLIETDFGELMHKRPFSYQEIGGEQKEVDVSFKKLAKNSYGFDVAEYDRNHELVIDPVVLAYSTYLGAGYYSCGYGIAVDSSGYIYVTGYTPTSVFPILNQYQTYQGGVGVVVTKLDPTQSGADSLLYSTYLGDSGRGLAIAADDNGNAYVTGTVSGPNFPTLNQYQTYQLGQDAFVTKLDTTQSGVSSLIYSTYLGSGGNGCMYSSDYGYGIAVDANGYIYVTGETYTLYCQDFPTRNEYQGAQGRHDVFVTKLDPNQSGDASLLYSTYLGGDGTDKGWGIAVDDGGIAYVTGLTQSAFPTRNPYQGIQGNADAFIAKLDTNQSGSDSLLFSTHLGGSGYDDGKAIALDAEGNIYVTGQTGSTNFPILNQYQDFQGYSDVFVTKLAPTQSGSYSPLYSTYLGCSEQEGGRGIAVDNRGNAYVAGYTSGPDFPVLNQYQTEQGKISVFVTRLDTTQSGTGSLIYSTYLSGNGWDYGHAVALDSGGNAYVTGSTKSYDFPIANQFQEYIGGNQNIFVTKLSFEPPVDPVVIPPEEREFLVEFYNDSNGDSWTDNTGWKDGELGTDGFGEPGSEENWFGVIIGYVNGEKHILQLDLKYNNLNGTIPQFLRSLPHIRHIKLQGNNLTGGIPAWMGELVSLNELNLSNNGLGGSIPTELSNLINLKTLSLAGCSLSGSIPVQLGAMANLEQLSLANNSLTGTIPVELAGLSKLININLGNNNLNPGPIPSWLGNMTSLQYLQLYYNNFNGTIPASLGNLVNLRILNLRFNMLSGDVPSSLMNLSQLFKLSIEGNDGLFTNDPALQAWLDALNPGWGD